MAVAFGYSRDRAGPGGLSNVRSLRLTGKVQFLYKYVTVFMPQSTMVCFFNILKETRDQDLYRKRGSGHDEPLQRGEGAQGPIAG